MKFGTATSHPITSTVTNFVIGANRCLMIASNAPVARLAMPPPAALRSPPTAPLAPFTIGLIIGSASARDGIATDASVIATNSAPPIASTRP